MTCRVWSTSFVLWLCPPPGLSIPTLSCSLHIIPSFTWENRGTVDLRRRSTKFNRNTRLFWRYEATQTCLYSLIATAWDCGVCERSRCAGCSLNWSVTPLQPVSSVTLHMSPLFDLSPSPATGKFCMRSGWLLTLKGKDKSHDPDQGFTSSQTLKARCFLVKEPSYVKLVIDQFSTKQQLRLADLTDKKKKKSFIWFIKWPIRTW